MSWSISGSDDFQRLCPAQRDALPDGLPEGVPDDDGQREDQVAQRHHPDEEEWRVRQTQCHAQTGGSPGDNLTFGL